MPNGVEIRIGVAEKEAAKCPRRKCLKRKEVANGIGLTPRTHALLHMLYPFAAAADSQ
jgi:hypothetical protein